MHTQHTHATMSTRDVCNDRQPLPSHIAIRDGNCIVTRNR